MLAKNFLFLKKRVVFHFFTTFKIIKSAIVNSVSCVVSTEVQNLCTASYFFLCAAFLCLFGFFKLPNDKLTQTQAGKSCLIVLNWEYFVAFRQSPFFFELPSKDDEMARVIHIAQRLKHAISKRKCKHYAISFICYWSLLYDKRKY